MARRDLAVTAGGAMAPSVETAAKPLETHGALSLAGGWAVALGLSFIGLGMGLGLAVGAIGATGPLSPARTDQLWMMSFGLLFVMVIGAALTGTGLGDWRTGSGTFFSAAFVLLILAPSNILLRHVFDPQEEAAVRAMIGLTLLVPNFFVYRLIDAVASRARHRRRSGGAPSSSPCRHIRESI